jgi:secreted trypsin-like serine protease
MMIGLSIRELFSLLLLINLSVGERYSCDRTRSCGCGYSDVLMDTRTANGDIARPHSWSMVVSIRYDASQNGKSDICTCAGTILTDSYILTAAHCFESIRGVVHLTDITMTAGTHRRSHIVGDIAQIILHPDWTGSSTDYQHDIAILHLAEPLNFEMNDKLSKACLPPKVGTTEEIMQHPNKNDLLAVIGQSRRERSSSESDVLRQFLVGSVDANTTECTKMISDSQRQFCARSIKIDSSERLSVLRGIPVMSPLAYFFS